MLVPRDSQARKGVIDFDYQEKLGLYYIVGQGTICMPFEWSMLVSVDAPWQILMIDKGNMHNLRSSDQGLSKG